MSFSFTDPVQTGLLAATNGLSIYQREVAAAEQQATSVPRTHYVKRSRFEQHKTDKSLTKSNVTWPAYPLLARVTDKLIDAERLHHQEEYCEWLTVRNDSDAVTEIVFTTEFYETFGALAAVSFSALCRGVQELYPDAQPTEAELFGPNFTADAATPDERAQRFLEHRNSNPWNNGTKGILFLSHGSNTLGALYGLLGPCAVPTDAPASDRCGAVAGSCVPGRSSDPRVCQACQTLAQANQVLCLEDPVGIRITELQNLWQLNGVDIDINDPATNQGIWQLSRNGRRGILKVQPGLTLDSAPIVSGAQVATALFVGAEVLVGPRALLQTPKGATL